MITGVIGGTGMIGSKVVELLAASGDEVRILTRTAPKRMAQGVSHSSIDLATGKGLQEALSGLETVVDVGNTRKSPETTLVEGTQRILQQCAELEIGHYVGISIIGCEKVNIGYYRAKAAQEEVIRSGPVGWSLLRATQFHELLDMVFREAARRGVTPTAKIPLQTVAASEAADVLVSMAKAGASRETTQLTGPELTTLSAMSKTWRRAMNRRTLLLPIPAFGKTLKGLRAGELTAPEIKGSGPTFAEWLLAD